MNKSDEMITEQQVKNARKMNESENKQTKEALKILNSEKSVMESRDKAKEFEKMCKSKIGKSFEGCPNSIDDCVRCTIEFYETALTEQAEYYRDELIKKINEWEKKFYNSNINTGRSKFIRSLFNDFESFVNKILLEATNDKQGDRYGSRQHETVQAFSESISSLLSSTGRQRVSC